jgi:rhodanese-related sulfurtransferase
MKTKYIIYLLLFVFIVSCVSYDRSAATDYTQYQNLAALINEQTIPYILVDVRSQAEYCDGYIPTAINIAHDVIKDNLPTTDKNALIIVYCRGGVRSSAAAETLKGFGYTNIVDFGGWPKWQSDLVKCD